MRTVLLHITWRGEGGLPRNCYLTRQPTPTYLDWWSSRVNPRLAIPNSIYKKKNLAKTDAAYYTLVDPAGPVTQSQPQHVRTRNTFIDSIYPHSGSSPLPLRDTPA